MPATKQKKRVRVEQPTWEEWVSRAPTSAIKSGETQDRMYQAIASLAYSYWEARGRQGGSAEEDWLRAEAEIRLSSRDLAS